MRPPVCRVCGVDFREEGPTGPGDLLTFAMTGDDPTDPDSTTETGHRSYADWFCGRHVEPARRLRHLTLADAVARLRGDEETR
ncbi:hypothetical protein [Haloarchaeobius sp. DFWS5]|uniref:hypothetical protein n=1 Tax=Haloarchaeobius sp. DFWS5 TaxID=3446114 RepID=UPI003EBE9C12